MMQLLLHVLAQWIVPRYCRSKRSDKLHSNTELHQWDYLRFLAQMHIHFAYHSSMLGHTYFGGPLANVLLKCFGAKVSMSAYLG